MENNGGLLDFIKSPEGQGLLATVFGGLAGAQRGQPLNNIGRAGMSGLSGYSNAEDRQLNHQKEALQIQQATRQNALMNKWMAGLSDGEPSPSGEPSPIGQSSASLPSAALPSGSAPTNTAQPPVINPTQGGMPGVVGSIPKNALFADLAMNGGKNIGDWMYKKGTPNWQAVNGNMVDTNAPGFKGGLQKGVQISANGQSTMSTPDGNGGVVISSPPGALATFGSYQDAGEKAKANYGFTDVPDGKGGTIKMPTNQALQVLGNRQNILSAGNSQPPLQQTSPIQPNIANNVNLNPGLNNQQSGRLGVTPSAAQSEAEKEKVLGPIKATNAFNEARNANTAKYEDALNSRIGQGADLNMRIGEALKAMETFQGGGGMESRAQLAQAAQAIGLPKELVDKISGGDLAAAQEFNKLAAQQAMEQLKQAMGGAGRISQYEFKVFQQNNPNLSTDPEAVRKIYDFNTRIFNRDLSEQKAFNDHVDSGKNPASFPMLWQSQQSKLGFTNPGLDAGSNKNRVLNVPKVNPHANKTDAQIKAELGI